MAYRQVSREELEDYLARNPGASYRVNGQEYTAPTEDSNQSGLMKILTSLTNPLRMVGGSAYSAITGKEKDNPFLTQSEELRYAKDPTVAGTKAAIGLGSYLLPVGAAKGITSAGGRIGSAAVRGITPGAMGSYALSQEGKELESILGGAGLGAVMGGGLQAVGEGVKALKGLKTGGKVQEFGLETRGKAIGLDANKLASKKGVNVNSATQGKKVIKSYFDTMDELGLPTNTSELASQSSDEALELLNSQFDDILSRADDTVAFTAKDTTNLLNKMDSAFAGNKNVLNNAQYLELKTKLTNLGSNYTPSALNSVREEARNLINWASSNNAGVTRRASEEFFDVVDDFFKTQIPESKAILSKARDVYTVRPFFQAKAPGAGSIKVGTASTNIAVPSGAIQERIPEAIGRGLQGAKTPSGLPNVLEPILQAGQRAIPATTGLTQIPGVQPIQEQQVQPQVQDQGQISASEANAVLSLLGMGGTGAKLTEKQKMFKSAGQTAAEALNLLESGAAKTGKIQGVGTAVGKFFGTQDPAQTEYLAKLDGARMAAISALSGANVPPSEYERMRNLIPEPNDEYNVAVEKLRAFQQVMDTYAQSYGSDTSGDTAGLLQTLGLQ